VAAGHCRAQHGAGAGDAGDLGAGDPEVGEHQRAGDRGLAAAVNVDWRAGDLMLIDNVLVAHGRRPFTGSRRVLVAMSGREGAPAG
jgi:hypothetical protein